MKRENKILYSIYTSTKFSEFSLKKALFLCFNLNKNTKKKTFVLSSGNKKKEFKLNLELHSHNNKNLQKKKDYAKMKG